MTDKEEMKKRCFKDEDGIIRFKGNSLIDEGLADRLNDLHFKYQSRKYWPEWEQLYQLMGYSLDSYCNLDYVRKKSKDLAWQVLETWDEKDY